MSLQWLLDPKPQLVKSLWSDVWEQRNKPKPWKKQGQSSPDIPEIRTHTGWWMVQKSGGPHQLRLVVELPLFTRFCTSQVVQDFWTINSRKTSHQGRICQSSSVLAGVSSYKYGWLVGWVVCLFIYFAVNQSSWYKQRWILTSRPLTETSSSHVMKDRRIWLDEAPMEFAQTTPIGIMKNKMCYVLPPEN